MVKDSYHFMYFYFRNPADTVANLNRFIETVDRIVPLSDEKKEMIMEQALSEVRQQKEKLPLTDQMFNLTFSIEEHITLMGTNIIDVMRNNFNDEEFARLYNTMEREMRWAIFAQNVLDVNIHKGTTPKTRAGEAPKQIDRLNLVFDRFGIQ